MLLKIDGYGEEERKERYKCKTDLFYLATEYLGYDLVESVHRSVCDFFVHKDPNKPIEQWDTIKDRLLIDPREHYKTTIDVADLIQSILCFPDIRIAIFSGSEDLAKEIMQMAQRQFQLNDKFKELFNEHAIEEGKQLPVYDFITPARTNWRLREKTITISTILSTSTGGHYEEVRYDDIVTDQNSQTQDQLEKTKQRVKGTVPLVVVGGYRYFIGTRYDFSDAYGEIIDRVEKVQKKITIIPFGRIIEAQEEDNVWKIFERKACSLPLTRESEILFTENRIGKKAFNYAELGKRRKEMGDSQFGAQYLNDPLWGSSSKFTEKMLTDVMIPYEQILSTVLLRRDPMTSQWFRSTKVFITWDLAFSIEKQANRTVGAVGCYDRFGRLFLIDLEVGKFTPDEFILKFLSLLRKWYPWMGQVSIEKAGGSQLIEPSLRAGMLNIRTGLPINWVKSTPKRIKAERVLSMIPLLVNKRMFINKDLPYLDDLIQEFIRFPKFRLDDIPDACSMLLDYQSTVEVVTPAPDLITALQPTYEDNFLLGYGING